MNWDKLSMADRAKFILMGVSNGITDLGTIRDTYNLYALGGYLDDIVENKESEEPMKINPAYDVAIKARLALDSHFGNPTARRMTNYDTRNYIFDGTETDEYGNPIRNQEEDEYNTGFAEKGNVFVSSFDNLVTPLIQDRNGELTFISDPWSKENDWPSYQQSIIMETPELAEYFGEQYKRFAPMMKLYNERGVYSKGGKVHKFDGGGSKESRIEYKDITTGEVFDHIPKGKVIFRKGDKLKPEYIAEANKVAEDYSMEHPIMLNELVVTPDGYKEPEVTSIDPTMTELNMLERSRVKTADNYVYNLSPEKTLDKIKEPATFASNYIIGKFRSPTELEPMENISRMNIGEYGKMFFNEFSEYNDNTIRLAKDFINTNDTLLGDKKIPLSKISLFLGAEDGKWKIGPIDIFNEDTYIFPVRSSNRGKVKKIILGTLDSPDYDAMEKLAEKEKAVPEKVPWYKRLVGAGLNQAYKRNIALYRYYRKLRDSGNYPVKSTPEFFGITENNDTIPLSAFSIDTSHKSVWGNENGNSLFINNLKDFNNDQLQELNYYLENTPLYPVLVDNGRYSHYDLNGMKTESYLSPFDKNRNMYVVGSVNNSNKFSGGGGTTRSR